MSITVPLEGFGGGVPLNFAVKAYTSEEALLAAAPKENTIGIITTTAISSWIFSATQPAEAAEGMVWIILGTSSAVEFNALKKNALQVYPLEAKQYVGGAWVEKTYMVYKNGEWAMPETKVWLLKDGVYDTENLVGFTQTEQSGNDDGEYAEILKHAGYIEAIAVAVSSSGVGGTFESNVSIPSKDFDTLCVELEAELGTVSSCYFRVGGCSYTISSSLTKRVVMLDISALTSDYPLLIDVNAAVTGTWQSSVKFYNMWLE